MNKKVYAAEVLVLLLAAKAAAQPSYCLNIVGYFNCSFVTGSNLFNNPLGASDPSGLNDNSLSNVLPEVPDGTTVSLWNPATSAFDTNSTFASGSWSTNFQLPPGTGALVKAPSPFAATLIGTPLNHDGSTWCAITNFLPPPLFTGPNGIYLLGDKAPVTDVGTNIFLNIVGRMPFVGEQVIQLTNISTYLGNGMWDSVPTLELGYSAFLNIITEPSPLLSIVYTNGEAIVSWPPTTSVWSLQTNGDLVAGTWTNYTGIVVNNTVTNPVSAGNLFFRLSYP